MTDTEHDNPNSQMIQKLTESIQERVTIGTYSHGDFRNLERLIKTSEQNQLNTAAANAHCAIAELYASEGNMQKAVMHYSRARHFFEESEAQDQEPRTREVATVLMRLADIAGLMGRSPDALKRIDESIRFTCERDPHAPILALQHTMRAMILIRLEDMDNALATADEALNTAAAMLETIHEHPEYEHFIFNEATWNGWLLRAELATLRKDAQEAWQWLNLANSSNDNAATFRYAQAQFMMARASAIDPQNDYADFINAAVDALGEDVLPLVKGRELLSEAYNFYRNGLIEDAKYLAELAMIIFAENDAMMLKMSANRLMQVN